MATLKEYQGHDVGKNMLKHVFAIGFALCEIIGCRVVIVDAKKDERTINFYKKYGSFEDFGPSDNTTQSLLRDLNKIPGEERVNTEITDKFPKS
jgi:GNAT superfamily N-acetyltransferase